MNPGMDWNDLSQARDATPNAPDGRRVRVEELQRFLAQPDRPQIDGRDGDAQQSRTGSQLTSGIDR